MRAAELTTAESQNYVEREARCRGKDCGEKIRERVPRHPWKRPPARTLCSDCLAEAFRKPEARR